MMGRLIRANARRASKVHRPRRQDQMVSHRNSEKAPLSQRPATITTQDHHEAAYYATRFRSQKKKVSSDFTTSVKTDGRAGERAATAQIGWADGQWQALRGPHRPAPPRPLAPA